jgi:undecaprenyl-diphosphatase
MLIQFYFQIIYFDLSLKSMEILKSILLGLIQGLTEFIPISSTAHMTLMGYILEMDVKQHPELWTEKIAIIQLGTLLAVVWYFRNDLIAIIKDLYSDLFKEKTYKFSKLSQNSKLGIYIVLGTLPIVVIGVALKKLIEGSFTKELSTIGFGLIFISLLLIVAQRVGKFNKDAEKLNIFNSLIIGLSQCIALIPGASRSGSTMMAGFFLGFDKETTARFSFLLSIPAILGSGIFEVKKAIGIIPDTEWLNIAVAFVAALISGYASIAFFLKFLKTNNLNVFIIYRIILGLILLYLAFA